VGDPALRARRDRRALAPAAHQATEEGRFEREIVPFQVTARPMCPIRASARDEPRGAGGLKPAFKPDGKITAGNSSQISDGAAAMLLMSADKAAELGVKPRARIVDQTTVGVDPVMMLTGPIPATQKLLERNGMKISTSTCSRSTRPSPRSCWPGCASCSPTWTASTSTAARWRSAPARVHRRALLTTLLHEMERTDSETGLVTMCCGGGLGTGTIIQRV
jgi:acetyl-CoA acetyltransferase